MLINRKPHIQQNIYTNQHDQKEPATKPRNVRQDKGFLTKALPATGQPGPVARWSRANAAKTKRAHPAPRRSARGKLIHTTLWLDPVVRAEFERIAAREQLSISQVGAAACADWVRSDIHRQQGALAELTQRQMIREELQAFGGRIVFFLMRIAFSAEQTRHLP